MLSLIPIAGPALVVFFLLAWGLTQSGFYPPEIGTLAFALLIALFF